MFEIYEKGATQPDLRPDATILKKGTLHLNQAARNLLPEGDYVELLFDATRKVIGLKGASAGSQNAYKLSSVRGVAWSVSLVAFLKYYSIEVPESRRRIPYVEGDVLCINLMEPGVVVDRGSS